MQQWRPSFLLGNQMQFGGTRFVMTLFNKLTDQNKCSSHFTKSPRLKCKMRTKQLPLVLTRDLASYLFVLRSFSYCLEKRKLLLMEFQSFVFCAGPSLLNGLHCGTWVESFGISNA